MKQSINTPERGHSRLNPSRVFKDRIGVSGPTFERRKASGDIPPPDAVIDRRQFWLDETIDAYIHAKIAATPAFTRRAAPSPRTADAPMRRRTKPTPSSIR